MQNNFFCPVVDIIAPLHPFHLTGTLQVLGHAPVSYTHLDVYKRQIQGGGKINHIPICAAAEAVVTPIQLHTGGLIVMERAASHTVPTYMDSIMLRSLSCCDGLLHSFK